MNCNCENCGWSEIVAGSPIMCHYNGYRTWRDECCKAWKQKELESFLTNYQAKILKDTFKNFIVVVRCIDCKWYDEQISMCNNCGLPREQTFFCADGKRRNDDN